MRCLHVHLHTQLTCQIEFCPPSLTLIYTWNNHHLKEKPQLYLFVNMLWLWFMNILIGLSRFGLEFMPARKYNNSMYIKPADMQHTVHNEATLNKQYDALCRYVTWNNKFCSSLMCIHGIHTDQRYWQQHVNSTLCIWIYTNTFQPQHWVFLSSPPSFVVSQFMYSIRNTGRVTQWAAFAVRNEPGAVGKHSSLNKNNTWQLTESNTFLCVWGDAFIFTE